MTELAALKSDGVRIVRVTYPDLHGPEFALHCWRSAREQFAAYQPLETDPAIDGELRAIIRSALVDQTELPFIPAAPEPVVAPAGGERRHNRRRERAG